MPTNRVPLRRRVRGELSSDEEMCLWLGVGRGEFRFESEDEARELWARHRERLMSMYARDGRRPHAWWAFDAPDGLVYDQDTEQSTLYEADLLAPDERKELVAWWREQFERCHQPGFAYCTGEFDSKCQSVWLRGRAAREAHLRWADIPAKFREKWTAERRASPGVV